MDQCCLHVRGIFRHFNLVQSMRNAKDNSLTGIKGLGVCAMCALKNEETENVETKTNLSRRKVSKSHVCKK